MGEALYRAHSRPLRSLPVCGAPAVTTALSTSLKPTKQSNESERELVNYFRHSFTCRAPVISSQSSLFAQPRGTFRNIATELWQTPHTQQAIVQSQNMRYGLGLSLHTAVLGHDPPDHGYLFR